VLYAAAAFWLMLIVLMAWGVHSLWSRLIQPKAVNILLLPGTLVAQVGHVVGLLVTGGTIRDTTLMGDHETGAPETGGEAAPRVPLIGTIVVAMLPMAALGAAFFLSIRQIGAPLMSRLPLEPPLAQSLPRTLPAFWDQLHRLLTLAERTFETLRLLDFTDWRNILLVYLLVCTSVRMAPLPGNRRGHLGAIVAVGLLAALVGTLAPAVPQRLQESWPILTLAVSTLLLLLILSLLLHGVVGLVRIVIRG
jgi:hypothetical protein